MLHGFTQIKLFRVVYNFYTRLYSIASEIKMDLENSINHEMKICSLDPRAYFSRLNKDKLNKLWQKVNPLID